MELTFNIGNDDCFCTHANSVSIGKNLRFPDLKKWKRMLIEEHSSLEFSDFFVNMLADGRAISHLVRHTKGHPRHVVQSQREDWTGEVRPSPETERRYFSKWTPYSWIQMARQRLCFKAAKYTRDIIVKAKLDMSMDTDYFKGISWASIPECVYRDGCPYSRSCGWFDKNKEKYYGKSIVERYDIYEESIKEEQA